MYKNILLATDLAHDNQALIDKASALQKTWHSDLSLVHIVEPLPSYGYAYVGSADVESQLIDEAKQKLADIAERINIPKDNCHVEVGPTKVEILRLAKEHNADLIMVGSHGRHGLATLLGSTANAVLHHAHCDVLTVRLK